MKGLAIRKNFILVSPRCSLSPEAKYPNILLPMSNAIIQQLLAKDNKWVFYR